MSMIPAPVRAVQYNPIYCAEASEDYRKNRGGPWTRFDSSHDLSLIDADGQRHRIGTFKSAALANAVGEMIEQHGLPGFVEGPDQ